jgi:hypothetical protein
MSQEKGAEETAPTESTLHYTLHHTHGTILRLFIFNVKLVRWRTKANQRAPDDLVNQSNVACSCQLSPHGRMISSHDQRNWIFWNPTRIPILIFFCPRFLFFSHILLTHCLIVNSMWMWRNECD